MKIVLFVFESDLHLFRDQLNHIMKNSPIKDIDIYKAGYTKRLEVSLIVSLLILIILFYLFPVFLSGAFILPDISNPQITVIEIPQTVQKYAKRPPQPSRPAIPIPSDDIALLDDIPIEFEQVQDFIMPGKIFNPDELEGLPYMPRQVLEVLPEKTENNPKGEILLSLHIDKNGKVKTHKVISNTTGSDICLQHVIKAAYSSRWQPVIIDSSIYEYWIYKTYKFE
ncbi:MAG: hypothetical protein JW956_01120 [Calditrichaceae bacterium]|nr:hypothetical protein [Calditrichaceae bacterium]